MDIPHELPRFLRELAHALRDIAHQTHNGLGGRLLTWADLLAERARMLEDATRSPTPR